ncbi:essential MCU regulator, mitochondrial [Copidosoma floridanum]|uniref:essential MCU regulator, mitochondrial n=1 Tax=Copidosoma floridanum TaxID=29053 RepID=UPI0006C9C907|nr:essential MCU regulator, mitochondrial [Copidosoma floridanum]
MSLMRGGTSLLKIARPAKVGIASGYCMRSLVTSPSGAILPEPQKPRFGYLGVICAVSTGLFIGATISKNVANFLEENELFVPSDDDDDDD